MAVVDDVVVYRQLLEQNRTSHLTKYMRSVERESRSYIYVSIYLYTLIGGKARAEQHKYR